MLQCDGIAKSVTEKNNRRAGVGSAAKKTVQALTVSFSREGRGFLLYEGIIQIRVGQKEIFSYYPLILL